MMAKPVLKSLKSRSYRFVVVLLLLGCLLTLNVGRLVPVFALAEEEITPELEPVYDTEVVSLQDYVDNVLTDAQVAVFNILLGSYVASQAGLNEYDLEYPYTDRSGVIGWLQDAGMKLYKAIITGGSFDLITGTDLRTYIVTAASYAIGMAQKAHTYTDTNDFLDDVDNSTHYFVPIDPILQASINSYFGRDYGLWNWQFDTKPFKSNFTYNGTDLSVVENASYKNYLSYYDEPFVRVNYTASWASAYTNIRYSQQYLHQYNNLFINTSSHTVSLFDDDGNSVGTRITNGENIQSARRAFFNNGNLSTTSGNMDFIMTYNVSYNPSLYDTFVEVAQAYFDNNLPSVGYYSNVRVFVEDFVDHVYVGTNWATKQELFNITGLNFAQNDSPSYNQVPDNSYIDFKGFLTDIVNNTNILNVILDNLFKPDGTLNVDPALIKVSITIPDTNPLPVNLNEIEVYTHNEYLDVLKQNATAFGSVIGEFVAFWHNADWELTYVVLGSCIIVLIGAFIGKWGHS